MIFELGSEKYGIPIAAVDEILQLPEITRVPKAPGFVTGVINLRGKALPVIDQRRRFETNAAGDSRRPRVIVLTIGQLQAGFIVDGVSEILRLTPSSIAPAPDLPGEATRIFDRVATSDEKGMILLVDPAQLLDRAERDLLDHFAAAEGSASPS